LSLFVALSSAVPAARAQQDEIIVRVEEGQSLRDIAQQHLGDPDLWAEILRANGLGSITDIRPGVELRIQASQIREANQALQNSLEAIQKATQEGARLFAPDLIGRALGLRDEALARRMAGAWEETARLAADATAVAAEALDHALAQRDALAEALLSDRQGWVEGRRPEDLLWSDRDLNSILIEEEKVRTLSRSTAQITFRDDSRLRLNANSEAVIQRMRVDPLNRREEARVSLVEGDFYALLAGKSDRKSFELDIPQVETEIESTNFWVRRDDSGSKFTNYDERVLQVAAEGESVSLGENEGTMVRTGAPPAPKVELLVAPGLIAPADDMVSFTADVDLGWAAVPDAAGYWLEIAFDPAFSSMALTRWGLKETSFDASELDVGAYYWRVAALDKFGLPGARSDAWRFNLRVDGTPPFVSITAPEEGAILRQGPVPVVGETETGAALELNGSPVEVGPDGLFTADFVATPGINQLVLEVRDAAGNATRRERSFIFMPDERAAVIFDQALPQLGPRHFITDGDLLSLAGQTEAPKSKVLVRAADGAIRTAAFTDAQGRFRLNVPLRAETEAFSFQIVAPSGFASDDAFQASIDQVPPEIELEEVPPAVTAIEWLVLRGQARGADRLVLNGRPVELRGDEFEAPLTLGQGVNDLEMVATDRVGNVRVERWSVHLDQAPPELLRHELSRDRTEGGGSLAVEVAARDASSLTRVAPFTIEIGGTVYGDLLELDRSSGTYRATVVLPQAAQGAIRLKDVELEDYAGNRRRYGLR
jgi:hypothetical protein